MLLFHAAFACHGGEAAADQGGSREPCGFAAFARPGSPLLLPTVRAGDLTRLRPWLGSFLACLLYARQSLAAADERDAGDALAPARRAPRVLVRDDLDAIEGLRPLCFRELGLVGTTASEFGLFASDDEARSAPRGLRRMGRADSRGTRGRGCRSLRAAAAATARTERPVARAARHARRHAPLAQREGARRRSQATGLVSWIEARPPAATPTSRAVRLERLAFEEQVLLAHAADVLVCVHGAALTSALFMREGAVAIDVLPSNLSSTRGITSPSPRACTICSCRTPRTTRTTMRAAARRMRPRARRAPPTRLGGWSASASATATSPPTSARWLVLRQADVLVRQRMRLDRAHAPAVAPWLRGAWRTVEWSRCSIRLVKTRRTLLNCILNCTIWPLQVQRMVVSGREIVEEQLRVQNVDVKPVVAPVERVRALAQPKPVVNLDAALSRKSRHRLVEGDEVRVVLRLYELVRLQRALSRARSPQHGRLLLARRPKHGNGAQQAPKAARNAARVEVFVQPKPCEDRRARPQQRAEVAPLPVLRVREIVVHDDFGAAATRDGLAARVAVAAAIALVVLSFAAARGR